MQAVVAIENVLKTTNLERVHSFQEGDTLLLPAIPTLAVVYILQRVSRYV